MVFRSTVYRNDDFPGTLKGPTSAGEAILRVTIMQRKSKEKIIDVPRHLGYLVFSY